MVNSSKVPAILPVVGAFLYFPLCSETSDILFLSNAPYESS